MKKVRWDYFCSSVKEILEKFKTVGIINDEAVFSEKYCPFINDYSNMFFHTFRPPPPPQSRS